MSSPIGQINKTVEEFLHPGVRVAFETAERVFVGKAGRGDDRARRVRTQLLHFFLAQPSVDGLKFVILVLTHSLVRNVWLNLFYASRLDASHLSVSFRALDN